MTYLREHADETLLVHLVRAPTALVRPPTSAIGAGTPRLRVLRGEEPERDVDLEIPGTVGAHVVLVDRA